MAMFHDTFASLLQVTSAPVDLPECYSYDEWRAIRRAVADNPKDDTIRLAAADWLQEHDAANHADYIRFGIELAQMPIPPFVQAVSVQNWNLSEAFARYQASGLKIPLPPKHTRISFHVPFHSIFNFDTSNRIISPAKMTGKTIEVQFPTKDGNLTFHPSYETFHPSYELRNYHSSCFLIVDWIQPANEPSLYEVTGYITHEDPLGDQRPRYQEIMETMAATEPLIFTHMLLDWNTVFQEAPIRIASAYLMRGFLGRVMIHPHNWYYLHDVIRKEQPIEEVAFWTQPDLPDFGWNPQAVGNGQWVYRSKNQAKGKKPRFIRYHRSFLLLLKEVWPTIMFCHLGVSPAEPGYFHTQED